MTALTVDLLTRAMTGPWPGPDIDPNDARRYLAPLTNACQRFSINTRARLAAFLAQTGHESGSFRWWREFGGENARYAPYYGRGPIQLTWRANYEAAGSALGLDLVSDPDLVARDPVVGFLTAGWFWRHGSGDLNTLADQATWASFDQITVRINGGFNGKDDRDARYGHAWNVLPADLTLEQQVEEEKVAERRVAFDRNEWAYDAETGAYLRADPNRRLRTNASGWLWREFLWPEASGTAQGSTNYIWRRDVEMIARETTYRFWRQTWPNTYVNHPPGWWRDTVSIDFWGFAGRGTPINSVVGQQIWDLLFNDPNPPQFEWGIWNGWIWTRSGGWQRYWDASDMHYDHVHVTYL